LRAAAPRHLALAPGDDVEIVSTAARTSVFALPGSLRPPLFRSSSIRSMLTTVDALTMS